MLFPQGETEVQCAWGVCGGLPHCKCEAEGAGAQGCLSPWVDFYSLKCSWAPLPCAGPPTGNLLTLTSTGKSSLSPWTRLGLPLKPPR